MMSLLTKFFKKSLPKTVTHLIWDVDGTLYKDDGRIYEAMVQMTIEYIVNEKGGKKKEISVHVREQIRNKRWLGDMVEQDFELDRHKLAKIVDLELDKSQYVNRNEQLVKLFENEFNVLNHSILTNGSRNSTEKVLKKVGFSESHPFFPIITADDLGKNIKPSEKGFRQIIESQNIKPEQVLVVGDTLPKDIYPAKKMGMYTCFVTTEDQIRKFDNADFVITSAEELKKLI